LFLLPSPLLWPKQQEWSTGEKPRPAAIGGGVHPILGQPVFTLKMCNKKEPALTILPVTNITARGVLLLLHTSAGRFTETILIDGWQLAKLAIVLILPCRRIAGFISWMWLMLGREGTESLVTVVW